MAAPARSQLGPAARANLLRASGIGWVKLAGRLTLDRDLRLFEAVIAVLLGGRLLNIIATRISRIGERSGRDRLIYNPVLFVWYHAVALRSAAGVARALEREIPAATSFTDVGAGSGAFSVLLSRRGKSVVAYEHSPLGRWIARRSKIDVRPFDLADASSAPSGRTDVAFSLEVAEHLPPDLGTRLVTFLTATSDLVVFTAATPGQGGHGHINEQPREYWVDRFEKAGFALDDPLTSSLAERFRSERVLYWLIDNVMVFRRV